MEKPLTPIANRSYADTVFTPVTLYGVVAPRTELDGSRYKLIGASGVEYFIEADDDWRHILAKYCWEDVKIKGLLNALTMTLIPQKIFPKGPTGKRVNKGRDLLKTWSWKIADLVLVPLAILVVMS